MKVKVILKETIKGVGKKDEIVEVKDGYANNFLFSQNKGIPATVENINKLKEKNEKIKRNHDRDVQKAKKLKELLDSKEIKIKVRAGSNRKVFGSIGSKEITDARMKELGLHTLELKLHSEVKVKIKVILEGQE